MKLVPLGDRVVLKQSEKEETTKSGIILTAKSQEKPVTAEVVAVGPGGMVDGKEVTMQVKVGDQVIYSKYAGNEVKLDEEEYVIRLLTASDEGMSVKKSGSAKTETAMGTTIKDMPAFDPDAEINSLALTIPSWISSVNRTRSAARFSLLTSESRSQLEQQLLQLQKTVQMMLYALKEGH